MYQQNKGTNEEIIYSFCYSILPSDLVVFIDFNRNGNFDDSGECFYILEAANPFTITSTITVPSNAPEIKNITEKIIKKSTLI